MTDTLKQNILAIPVNQNENVLENAFFEELKTECERIANIIAARCRQVDTTLNSIDLNVDYIVKKAQEKMIQDDGKNCTIQNIFEQSESYKTKQQQQIEKCHISAEKIDLDVIDSLSACGNNKDTENLGTAKIGNDYCDNKSNNRDNKTNFYDIVKYFSTGADSTHNIQKVFDTIASINNYVARYMMLCIIMHYIHISNVNNSKSLSDISDDCDNSYPSNVCYEYLMGKFGHKTTKVFSLSFTIDDGG